MRSTQIPRDVLCRVIGDRAEVGADVDVIEVTDPETGEVTTECRYNQTKHQTRLAERQARIDASNAIEADRDNKRILRLARIKANCQNSSNELVKDICRELLYLARQSLEEAAPAGAITTVRALSSQPRYIKRNETACQGEVACRALLGEAVCQSARTEFAGQQKQFLPLINSDYTSVYCAVSI